MSKSLREASTASWSSNDLATLEQINAGSLQRIADATELMAKNYVQMQKDLKFYKDRYIAGQAEITRLVRSRNGYIGVIAKLKKKTGNGKAHNKQ